MLAPSDPVRAASFFDGIHRTGLEVMGTSIEYPLFVYEARAMTAIFPARFAALKKMLPDRRFVPARIAPGVGVVALNAFEYMQTGLGPYNEFAVTVPLHLPAHGPNFPGRALLKAHRRRQYHAFIQSMPVSTEMAIAGGELYGFPKWLAKIEFSDDSDRRTCTVAQAGASVATLRGRRLRQRKTALIQGFSHLYLDRQPQSCEFQVNARRFGDSCVWGAASLELADTHQMAAQLRRVLLSKHSIYYREITDLQGILFGPDRPTIWIMEKLGVSMGRSPHPGPAAGEPLEGAAQWSDA